MMKKKAPPGRPTFEDHIKKSKKLTEQEMTYCRLRAKGYTIVEASHELKRYVGDMSRLENEYELMKDTINQLRQENLLQDANKISARKLKIISKFIEDLETKLENNELPIDQMIKAYEFLRTIESGQKELINMPTEKKVIKATGKPKPKLVEFMEEQQKQDIKNGKTEGDTEITEENKGKTLGDWWNEEYPEEIKPITRKAIQRE